MPDPAGASAPAPAPAPTTPSTETPAPASPIPTPAPAPAPAPAAFLGAAPRLPPGQFVPAPANIQPKYVSPKSYRITKLAGRVFSIICSIVTVGLGAGLLADSRIDGIYAIFIIPSAAACIAWDAAEIVCIMKREGNRGIHPGAIVGVDLILWLGLVFLTLLCVSFSVVNARHHVNGYYDSYYDHYGDVNSSSIDLDTPEYRALLSKIDALAKTLSAFFCFLTLTHFGLFVIGCIETSYRNRQPRMVYVMAPPQGYYFAAPPPGVLPAPYGATINGVHPQPIPMMPMQSGPDYAGEPKPAVAQAAERYA
ncbi:hypothetical protein QBC41DRAFT_238678 [Cercophora samala]|uniref:Uncharacterized protein n=1 Tax=Cercophora samala TaxID=330535 RepID=A0AA39YJ71_9PEZI|nr:hypothetical protein QBC41DRAFT_238678 [Cercophora samala]